MKTEIDNRAENQAKCQCESILAMTRALNRETAAQDYANEQTREKCVELLTGASIECYDDETTEELREALAVNIDDQTIEPDDFTFEEEEAREAIQGDALSVQVRSGWYTPGSEDTAPEEFEILLCTGGPACRIVGDLDGNAQPSRPRIQYQDWGTPWTEYFPTSEERDALETYCQQFYFGE